MLSQLRLLGAALSSVLFYALCVALGCSSLPAEIPLSNLILFFFTPCLGAVEVALLLTMGLVFCYMPASKFLELTEPASARKRK